MPWSRAFVPAGVKVAEAPEFVEALTALYGISYSLKFAIKQRKVEPVDYPVMALEGLWWVDGDAFEIGKLQEQNFNVMILQPGVVTADMFAEALDS